MFTEPQSTVVVHDGAREERHASLPSSSHTAQHSSASAPASFTQSSLLQSAPLQLQPQPFQQQQQQQQEQQGVLSDWSTGLFDCDKFIPSSLDAFLCSHCMSSSHFGVLYQGTPGIYFPVCIGLVCADMCWLCAFKWICAVELHNILVRREIRRRYNIWQDVRNPPRCCGCCCGAPAPPPSEAANGTAPVIVVGGFRQLAMDVLVSFCCSPCVVAQHHRELTAQGAWPGEIVFSRDPPVSAVEVSLDPPGVSTTH